MYVELKVRDALYKYYKQAYESKMVHAIDKLPFVIFNTRKIN